MTHEFKKILQAYIVAKAAHIKTVLATVVALDGSSYRRPGVRMLIREDGKMIGAVSGGCVEKEVCWQAESVFKTGRPKTMIYDGRYRLGCEGILYILLEPFEPNNELINTFDKIVAKRESFRIYSYFLKKESMHEGFGSILVFDGALFAFRDGFLADLQKTKVFEQQMLPCFRLIIVGAEHDAVQLSSYASLTGWEVTIVAPSSEEKNISDFPGASEFISCRAEDFDTSIIDEQTAVLLMTHGYVKDLKYLLNLRDTLPVYIGLLGTSNRREKLLGELIERHPEVSDRFFDRIHGPAGLSIGAETAQEIAISILSEILSVTRSQEPMPLHKKLGTIHE